MKKYQRFISYVLAAIMMMSFTALPVGAQTQSKNCETNGYVISSEEICAALKYAGESIPCKSCENTYDCSRNQCKDNNCDDSCDRMCFVIHKLSEVFKNTCFGALFPDCKDPNFGVNPTENTPDEPVVPTESIIPTQNTEPTEAVSATEATKPTQSQTPSVPPTEKPSQSPTEKPTQMPTQSPTSAPTEPQIDSNGFNEAYADEVIRLVNIERQNAGLSPLSKREDVTSITKVRAKEITQNFSHTRPNGTSCFTLFKENSISYRSVGENIAYGYNSPKSVVEAWMNSKGHRENILSSSYNGIGVACFEQNGTLYWSQFFIGA